MHRASPLTARVLEDITTPRRPVQSLPASRAGRKKMRARLIGLGLGVAIATAAGLGLNALVPQAPAGFGTPGGQMPWIR